MTSIIHFTPVSGGINSQIPCYLLKIDGFTFMLDCGCDENFTLEYLNELKPYIPYIDAVLLSHPDTSHLGALPYLMTKCGLKCDIYATVPVFQLGQMFMYDFFYSHDEFEDFTAFSLDDIDVAFKNVEKNVIKFNQTVTFKDKGDGITITPLYAGHMLGGTIWKISKDGEEDVFYCMDINNKPERHLNECAFDKINSPSLLIYDCLNVGYINDRRRSRDEKFLQTILETLRDDGSVLVSVDTAGRMLELALLLDQTWRVESGLAVYPIALINKVSSSTMEFAKSMIEWMNDKLTKSFQGQRNNPFVFKHIELLQNLSELDKLQKPFVVLATQPDLDCGYSRELFFRLHSDSKNHVILTQRPRPGSLGHSLVNLPDNKSLKIVHSFKLDLEGEELEEYLEKKRLEEEEQAKLEFDSDSDDSDEENFFDSMDNDDEYNFNQKKHIVKHDLVVANKTSQSSSKARIFSKSVKKSFPLYPFVEQKLKWDEYGEIINPDDYVMFDISKAAIEEEDTYRAETGQTKEEETVNYAAFEEKPTKCVKEIKELQVDCRVTMLDFEGRSDDASLKQVIENIKLKDIILVRGSEENQEAFAEFCSEKSTGKVFMSDSTGTIDATSDRNVYQVVLRDSLLSSLKWARAADGKEFAWIDAEIQISKPETFGERTDVDNSLILRKGARDNLPALIRTEATMQRNHQTVMIRNHDIKNFRNVLKDNGISTKAIRSGLLCNDNVIVNLKKSDEVIEIEGVISEEYFTIRDLLHQQFTVL